MKERRKEECYVLSSVGTALASEEASGTGGGGVTSFWGALLPRKGVRGPRRLSTAAATRYEGELLALLVINLQHFWFTTVSFLFSNNGA